MDDTVVFRGEGPCDDFLRAVRKAAFDKGKHKDGDWMAGYAPTCFAGEALRWYEGLDEDVQDDWKQLRTAMLERFPPVSGQPTPTASEPSPASIPGNFIPTPAAAPPAAAPPAAAPPAAAPPAAAPPPPGSAASPPVPRPREIHVSHPPPPSRPLPPRPSPPTSASLSGAFSKRWGSQPDHGWIGRSRINGSYEVTSDPSQALRVANMTASPNPSEVGGTGGAPRAFLKIKIFHPESDELIAIRVPPSVTYTQLIAKVRDRLGGAISVLKYRESYDENKGWPWRKIVGDADLRDWLSKGEKLVLYAD